MKEKSKFEVELTFPKELEDVQMPYGKILMKLEKNDTTETTESGIILPTVTKKQLKGIVMMAGNLILGNTIYPPYVHYGDEAIIDEYEGKDVVIEGNTYRIVDWESILYTIIKNNIDE